MTKTELARAAGILALTIGALLVALALASIPHTVSEAYQIQNASLELDHSFVVAPSNTIRYTRFLNYGDLLNIQVTVTSGGNREIDFSINRGGIQELSYPRITTIDTNWTAPTTTWLEFVYDNTFDSQSWKNITVKAIKYQTETTYRGITQTGPLLPPEFAYVGVITAISGTGLIFLARIERPRTPHLIR
jgi:hypothetical protein